MRAVHETVVALSTPPGRGGIAVIRITGPQALECAQQVFIASASTQIEPRESIFGRFRLHSSGHIIDEGFLTYHKSGRSYTGEDLVELSCHGSPTVVGLLLEELLAAGAQAASPGEFTYRALLHGRIDLAQAEGIRDLINAPSAQAARVAGEQARGALSQRLERMREELISLIAEAEASLEFGEEPDVRERGGQRAGRIAALANQIAAFVGSYRQGRLLREGARVVLAGRPNAGKSTLFNALLRSERAIVSEVPGTTRDFLSERIDLDGIPVSLVDTAGLRQIDAAIEAEGVRRSRAEMRGADLVVLLIPCGEQPIDEDRAILDAMGDRVIPAASKCDLGEASSIAGGVALSARTGDGLDRLRAAIFTRLAGVESLSGSELVITEARHHDALRRAASRLEAAAAVFAQGMTEEIWLADLHAALQSLGEITGQVPIEGLYDRIFNTFCIGK